MRTSTNPRVSADHVGNRRHQTHVTLQSRPNRRSGKKGFDDLKRSTRDGQGPHGNPWGHLPSDLTRCPAGPAVQDMYTRLLSANLDFDSELQHVFCWEPDECRDSRVFHVDRVFLRLCSMLFLVSGLGASNVTRGWQFLTRTHVFLVTVCCSPGSLEDSRVLGIVAVWSTAVDIC